MGAQADNVISGTVFKSINKVVIVGAKVSLEGEQVFTETDEKGVFKSTPNKTYYFLSVSARRKSYVFELLFPF